MLDILVSFPTGKDATAGCRRVPLGLLSHKVAKFGPGFVRVYLVLDERRSEERAVRKVLRAWRREEWRDPRAGLERGRSGVQGPPEPSSQSPHDNVISAELHRLFSLPHLQLYDPIAVLHAFIVRSTLRHCYGPKGDAKLQAVARLLHALLDAGQISKGKLEVVTGSLGASE